MTLGVNFQFHFALLAVWLFMMPQPGLFESRMELLSQDPLGYFWMLCGGWGLVSASL